MVIKKQLFFICVKFECKWDKASWLVPAKLRLLFYRSNHVWVHVFRSTSLQTYTSMLRLLIGTWIFLIKSCVTRKYGFFLALYNNFYRTSTFHKTNLKIWKYFLNKVIYNLVQISLYLHMLKKKDTHIVGPAFNCVSEVKCYYCISCTGAHFEHLLSDTVICLFTCEEKRIKLAVQIFPVKLSGWYEWYLCVWCFSEVKIKLR